MFVRRRVLMFALLDTLIVVISIFLSKILVYPGLESEEVFFNMVISAGVLGFSHHFFAWFYRLYTRAWEYASVGELIVIFKAVSLSILMTILTQYFFFDGIYIRMLMVTWMLHILLIGGSRFLWRVTQESLNKEPLNKRRTLIVGAGSAGTMVTRQLLRNKSAELYPVAFVDDDPKKQHLDIFGIPVLGGVDKIKNIVEELKIEHIIIAIPSLKRIELQKIFNECVKTKVKTQTIPMLEDIMVGKVSLNQFRDVQVEDLLGRDPIELDIESISGYITGKSVLVTGAGGSIGSEICRQVARFNPKKIILLGHGENSIYLIHKELMNTFPNSIDFITEIADIQDRNKMFSIMERYRPFVIFHAAAHKHVPLMELNPEEAIKNNVIGTKNVAEAADRFGVQSFVMISTDKAVKPSSAMGATKRIAEMIIQHMASISKTKFVAVRFGNVLGSRGSVIPLFKEQISRGGPVTVTHPEMKRYFMTIPEASRLVIQAGALAKGGEIFVLDMGEPVKIIDLAKNLIQLSGYDVEEIGIRFTGIRPGEKLFEELLNPEEVHEKQIYPKIYVGKSTKSDYKVIVDLLNRFESMNRNELKLLLLEIANQQVRSKHEATEIKPNVTVSSPLNALYK